MRAHGMVFCEFDVVGHVPDHPNSDALDCPGAGAGLEVAGAVPAIAADGFLAFLPYLVGCGKDALWDHRGICFVVHRLGHRPGAGKGWVRGGGHVAIEEALETRAKSPELVNSAWDEDVVHVEEFRDDRFARDGPVGILVDAFRSCVSFPFSVDCSAFVGVRYALRM